jgi:hypothetical protein
MNKMEDINVYNLHEHLSFNVFRQIQKIEIRWDGRNKRLNYLMANEDLLLNSKGYISNSMWVNQLKEMMNWKEGETICMWKYIYSTPGKMTVSVIVDPDNFQYRYLKVDENGYLFVKMDIDPENQGFRRCNSVYNDMIDEEKVSYVLK